MESKSIYYFVFLIFGLIFLISYQNDRPQNNACKKFINEKYLEESVDSIITKEAYQSHRILLQKFDENSIKGLNNEAYHLQFYSSHGFGKSITFEKNNTDYYLSIKCITKEDWFIDCKNYQIGINKEEWNKFEKMIYEFNFWTEENFRANQNVLDGHVYFLEGNRPEAKRCNKMTYKLVGRGSPGYDKIGALCEYILNYEDQLSLRHKKRIRKKN